MFLKLAGSYMEVELTGKFTNRGAGYRLEIPCKYHASGREIVVAWVGKKVNLIIKKHGCVVTRCLDQKNVKTVKQWVVLFSGQNIFLSDKKCPL